MGVLSVAAEDFNSPGTWTVDDNGPVDFDSQATIYIRPDGTVDPSTAPIQRYWNLYTVTDNIMSDGDGIIIERNNVTLDGAGYTVQGTGTGIGIDLSGRSNVTIKNIEIKAFSEGVDLSWSSNNTMAGNTIVENNCGIIFSYSSNNSLFSNHIADNYHYGVLFYTRSFSNTFRDNNLSGNNYHLGDDGVGDIILNDIDTSNTVDGKPIFCVTDKHDLLVDHSTFPHGVGYLELVNCSNVLVRGLTLTHNERGLYLRHTNNTIIENVTVSNSGIGIFAYSITNCTISANHVNKNEYSGIYLYSSHGNMISENTISENQLTGGIRLEHSNYNSILDNLISESMGPGIELGGSSSIIQGNTIQRCFDGITVKRGNNTISENNITDNHYGILLPSSYNNIHSNNFINNTIQVSTVRSYHNTWDNGYPSGGNYWSDHNPPDEDLDKIGDFPYVINENNTDRYPLIYPYGFVPKPDVNGDGVVNIKDMYIAAQAFGTEPGDDRWDPTGDVEMDETIGIKDLYKIWLFHNTRGFHQSIHQFLAVKRRMGTVERQSGYWRATVLNRILQPKCKTFACLYPVSCRSCLHCCQ